MPKMKTRRSVKKRIKLTGSGKVKHKKMGLRHILTKKASKRKRKLRALEVIGGKDAKRLKSMLSG